MRKSTSVVPVRDLPGLGRADVGDADQFHVIETGQHAGVGLPEVANSDDRHPERRHQQLLKRDRRQRTDDKTFCYCPLSSVVVLCHYAAIRKERTAGRYNWAANVRTNWTFSG